MTEEDEKSIERIEAYRNGELSADERVKFDIEYKGDETFKKEVDDYIAIMNSINTFEQKQFIKKVHTWERDIAERKEGKTISLRQILSIAAVLLILALSLGYFIFTTHPTTTNESLFTSYFQPYDDVLSQRTGSHDLLQQGMDQYNSRNYSKAIVLLKQWIKANPNAEGARCYLGISYLATGQLQEARSTFVELTTHESSLFTEVAEWNLALTYLKMEEAASVKETLNKILSRNDHLYYKQAKSLHEQLQSQ